MSVKERIRKYISYKKISIREFERLSNLNYGYVNAIRVSIQPDKVKSISLYFADLNTGWLLTGEGEMLKNDKPLYESEVTVIENKRGVPYYENIDVSLSILPMFSDNKEIPTFYIDYPHFNDCTAYLPVLGDSMYPKYASGEIIAIKQVFNFEMIQWGEAYLVVGNENTDNLRTVKLLYPYPDDLGRIVLRASNPNFKGDTPMYIQDIVSLFIIKGKITRSQL